MKQLDWTTEAQVVPTLSCLHTTNMAKVAVELRQPVRSIETLFHPSIHSSIHPSIRQKKRGRDTAILQFPTRLETSRNKKQNKGRLCSKVCVSGDPLECSRSAFGIAKFCHNFVVEKKNQKKENRDCSCSGGASSSAQTVTSMLLHVSRNFFGKKKTLCEKKPREKSRRTVYC